MMKFLNMDRDSDVITNSSLIPCLLCHQNLAALTDEHEKHLKLEHKVKFQMSWILKKTWKDWINNLSNVKGETLIEDDSIEEIKIESGISEENDQPYLSPSKLLVETSTYDDPKTFTDLDEYYSASELLANNKYVTNHKENEPNFEKKQSNPYKCSFCEKSFKTKSYVEVHEKKHSGEIIHNNKQNSVAENVTAPDLTRLNTARIDKKKKHNTVGNSNKPYECSICGKGFKIKNYVKLHEKKEHNVDTKSNKAYQCSICTKAFNTKYYVKTHEKKEHNYKRKSLKPYPCTFCDKYFKTKHYVEIHKKKHYSHSIMCSFEGCEKECLTSDDLKIHLKTHKKQKYTCSICAKGFKTKDYVLVHEKTNHNYQCSLCEKAFTNKSFARVHEKKKHSHVKTELEENINIV